MIEDEETTTLREPLPGGEDHRLRPCLEVVDSRDPALLGRVIPVGAGVAIGRHERADVCIDDRGVSREHARVFLAAGQVGVTDLASTNGTFVNGVRVERAILKVGDMVRIGLHTVLRFVREEARWSHRLTDSLLAGRVALWEWDAGSGSFCASSNFAQVVGLTPDEVPAAPEAILEWVHPDDRARAVAASRALAGASQPVELELRLAGPCDEVWLLVKAQAVAVTGGVAVTGSVCNVTARKRAERQLRRLTQVLENMHDAIVVVDRDGRITDWTSRAAATFAIARDRALGTKLSDLVGAGSFDALRAAVAERGHYTGELAVSRPSGATAVYELAAAALRDEDDADFLVGYVAAFRDVTARRALQEQVIASDKLAAIGTLAAGIAHEINNPLAYVTSGVDWLGERAEALASSLDRGDAGELRDVLAEMRLGVSRIGAIVGSLRTFSRRDDQPAVGPVRLAEVVRLAERIVANEVRHVALLRVDLPDDLHVRGNETRLMQVFINLIVNAAHAITAGDRTRNSIEIRVEEHARRAVTIAVRDTGAGMTPDVLARAFHPFFTTKPAGKGTGLGLSVTRTILESIGGEIRIDSEVGVGTTARITLPLASGYESAAPAAIEAEATAPARTAAVLIIDDEPLVATALARLLGSRGFEVAVAGDGPAGVELAIAGEFDAIVCDLMMPDMSGVDVYQRLSEARPELTERLLFVSGGAFTAREQGFVEEARRPVLRKPWSSDELLKAVGTVASATAAARRAKPSAA